MPISRPVARGRLILALAAAGSLALAGCGGSSDAPAGAGTADGGVSLVKAGKLTVCTHMSYKPFQFNKDGKVVGFDVDILDLVAKELKVEQEIVDIEFQQIWSGAAFKAKKCDLGAAAITMTDARRTSVLFSEPYFDATQALLTKKGSGITSLASLKGKKLGVQTETTGQEYGTANTSANGYEIVVFDDLPMTVNGVKAGRVDAAINDNGVLYDFAKENPDTEVVAEFATGEHYGIAAKKDDPAGTKLNETVNSVLKAARSDGRYDEIYKKWFGTAPGAKQSSAGASPTS